MMPPPSSEKKNKSHRRITTMPDRRRQANETRNGYGGINILATSLRGSNNENDVTTEGRESSLSRKLFHRQEDEKQGEEFVSFNFASDTAAAGEAQSRTGRLEQEHDDGSDDPSSDRTLAMSDASTTMEKVEIGRAHV